MSDSVRGVAETTLENARELRRAMTPAERVLWAALRGRRLNGMKFRRQYALGSFILDFCCVECRLVIELDGSGHDEAEQAAYDAFRTEQLEAYGYRVLRFRNDDVFRDFGATLTRIAELAASSPAPPRPGLGEGVGG